MSALPTVSAQPLVSAVPRVLETLSLSAQPRDELCETLWEVLSTLEPPVLELSLTDVPELVAVPDAPPTDELDPDELPSLVLTPWAVASVLLWPMA